MKTVAIIVAGGQGKRMGRPKQFLAIAGKPMIEWTLSAFQKSKVVDGVIVVVAENDLSRARRLRFSKIIDVVAGGKERQDSVRNGLRALPSAAEIVLVHDGARPAVTPKMIEAAVRGARRHGAVVLGVPVKDTTKKVKPNAEIIETVNREDLWQAQTPQAFRASILKKAYARARGKFTDDAMLVEKLGLPVKMIMGSYKNIKVTAPEDLGMIGTFLKGGRK